MLVLLSTRFVGFEPHQYAFHFILIFIFISSAFKCTVFARNGLFLSSVLNTPPVDNTCSYSSHIMVKERTESSLHLNVSSAQCAFYVFILAMALCVRIFIPVSRNSRKKIFSCQLFSRLVFHSK